MAKPFTGTVSELERIPFENHCAWDLDPEGTGAVSPPKPGPAADNVLVVRNSALISAYGFGRLLGPCT